MAKNKSNSKISMLVISIYYAPPAKGLICINSNILLDNYSEIV